VLQNSNNNNFIGSLLAGFVLTKQDDLQFQVTYYRADNGDAYLAPLTMPYGAAARQYSASAGVKHKFTDRLIGNAKVGYFDSVNDTSGGMTNELPQLEVILTRPFCFWGLPDGGYGNSWRRGTQPDSWNGRQSSGG